MMTDNGQRVITITHTELCSGELKSPLLRIDYLQLHLGTCISVDPLVEGTLCPGQRTGSYETYLPCTKCQKIYLFFTLVKNVGKSTFFFLPCKKSQKT